MYLYSRQIERNSIINIQIKENLFMLLKEYHASKGLKNLL